MLKNWDTKDWQHKYLLYTFETFKVPKDCLNLDGTCNVEEYKKYLKSDKELFFDSIFYGVALSREAEPYSMMEGYYMYHGTGVVIKYEPID
jgi:hypothetical protein